MHDERFDAIVGGDVVEQFDTVGIVEDDVMDFEQRDRSTRNGIGAADRHRDKCHNGNDRRDAPEPQSASQTAAIEIAVNVESHGSKTSQDQTRRKEKRPGFAAWPFPIV